MSDRVRRFGRSWNGPSSEGAATARGSVGRSADADHGRWFEFESVLQKSDRAWSGLRAGGLQESGRIGRADPVDVDQRIPGDRGLVILERAQEIGVGEPPIVDTIFIAIGLFITRTFLRAPSLLRSEGLLIGSLA